MKIVYIVKTKLHYYPPCISQIRMIKKLGGDIEVIYGTCDEKTRQLLEKENINCIKVGNLKDENPKIIEKGLSWLNYRNSLLKKMKQYEKENTVFWFGTAESLMPMKGLLHKYNYNATILELLDDDDLKRKLLKKMLKNAKVVCCCEETRAWLMKYWYELKELPFVFPNKPFDQLTKKRCNPTIDETKKIINDIKNSNILLSQGVLQTPEELIEFAKALNKTKNKYKFVLMGIDKYNCVEKLKEYYNDISVSYTHLTLPTIA